MDICQESREVLVLDVDGYVSILLQEGVAWIVRLMGSGTGALLKRSSLKQRGTLKTPLVQYKVWI